MQTHHIRSYQDALDYLYGFIDHERRPPNQPQQARYNLDRTRALLAAVGNPHEHMHTLVVAGTKGKGSTSAMLESIVRAAGYRTGLWSSPHLNSYRERIQINRQLISQEALIDAVQRLQPVVAAFDVAMYGKPSTFELGFALALRYFVEQQVQVAVLEVGMGGRYDCANVVRPLVSLVSSISYDHMPLLGTSLREIADNKAGIFKPGVEAITVPQQDEAMAVLTTTAATVGSPLWVATPAGIELAEHQPPHEALPTAAPLPYPVAPVCPLRGAFQQENARLALCAAWRLNSTDLTISEAAMSQGLATVQWPGRLEVAGESPWIVLDGAHNGDSARKLVAALYNEFTFKRLLLVLGVSQGKQLQAILQALVPHSALLILTRSRHPRSITDLDYIAAQASPYLHAPIMMTPDVPEGLEQARTMAKPGDLICVTGSLFVVGAAREALGLATECD